MVRKILIVAILVLAAAAGGVPEAGASLNYTFQMGLVSVTEDPARSGLLGKPDWYQWLYRVDVVAGGNTHHGLSHYTIELEDCFNGALLTAVRSTAGANGNPPNAGNLSGLTGDELRTYTVSTGNDPATGLYGIKWDLNDSSPNDFDHIGDYDYFWFSAPTEEAVTNSSIVKHGQYQTLAMVATPSCPECTPVIPEPATLTLLSAGFAAGGLRRKFRRA